MRVGVGARSVNLARRPQPLSMATELSPALISTFPGEVVAKRLWRLMLWRTQVAPLSKSAANRC